MTASRSSPDQSRRQLLKAATTAAIAAPFLALGGHRVSAASPKTYSTRVIDLVRDSLVIDMLAPLTLEIIWNPECYARPLTDAERAMFRSSGITGFHHSIGLGGPQAKQQVLDFMASWHGFIARNGELFQLVGTGADLDAAKRAGRIGVIFGVQDSDHFQEPKDVAHFYNLGQRCSQLTYNSQNLIGSGSTDRADGGLSDFGAEIVKAMNDVGMLVDVSHCGPKTTLDAIELSPKPIAVTHSNCKALNDHPRLKTDEAIKKLAAKGGVMGITGVRMFVKGAEPTTIEHIVDHVDHVVKLVGIDHVGIGSDTDLKGYDAMPEEARKKLHAGYKASYGFRARDDIEGFDHPQKVYDLTEVLLRRGYQDADVKAILGGNFRRLLGSTWV